MTAFMKWAVMWASVLTWLAVDAPPASASLPGGGGASCIAFMDFTQSSGQIKEIVSFRNCYGWELDGYSSFTGNGSTYKHFYNVCTWTSDSSCVSSHTFTNPAGTQTFHWQTDVRLCFPGGCETGADSTVWDYDQTEI